MTQRYRQERNPAPADLPPRRMGAKHWAVLLATAGMFGSTFLFINVAVAEVPPITLAAGRALLAAPIAWAFLGPSRPAAARRPARPAIAASPG